MRKLFGSMGRPLSKRIIANLMRLSDLDGSGTIDFENWLWFTGAGLDYLNFLALARFHFGIERRPSRSSGM